MTSSVQLRFVNLSEDYGVSNIVFFQKNDASNHNRSIAWRVVHRCGYSNYCEIPYAWDTDINMVDWNANHSERQAAYQSNIFHVTPQRHGKRLSAMPDSDHPTEIWVKNCLKRGAVHINLYRSGYLVAQQNNVIPEQWAKFYLPHQLCVAVMPDIKHGDTIPSQYLCSPVAEFCLLGIVSADIIMLGGGQGKDALALSFKMTNIVA